MIWFGNIYQGRQVGGERRETELDYYGSLYYMCCWCYFVGLFIIIVIVVIISISIITALKFQEINFCFNFLLLTVHYYMQRHSKILKQVDSSLFSTVNKEKRLYSYSTMKYGFMHKIIQTLKRTKLISYVMIPIVSIFFGQCAISDNVWF